MKVDGGFGVGWPGLAKAGAVAREQEQAGYSGFWTAETAHDPFFPLLLAAEQTSTIELGTSIAVAFARNPMTLANVGWDLQEFSQGRFILGLGSQIKPHITKRFSMEWSKPAARMREMVLAIRAIWAAWETGDKLDFRGDFYTHTLMTPFICHGFTTERYLREVTIPALDRGRAKAGRAPVSESDDFEIVGPSFVVTGNSPDELAAATQGTRQQISFYGSTPAYRPVLDLHGWGGLQDELNAMSKQGKWTEMAELIDDEVLNTFAVVGEPESIAPELKARYGDVIQRISFYAPYTSEPERWSKVFEELKGS
jgi:alkanesulfonate monooxygenase SsuD/methylene tetrahydromethanopterin reductase-like flavin-dependent oxidoreductase (luciferase family)